MLRALRRLLEIPERIARRLSRKRVFCGLFLFTLSFGMGAALSLRGSLPLPHIHDEFSYLLAADTFAQGRLSNPPHPHWRHFESLHVFHDPTYASKYPPMQGIFLALGIRALGHPIVGVWIGAGLAVASTYWMLLAWTRSTFALLGGLLLAIHPLLLFWSQCYWGGAVSLAGGALLTGAIPRLYRRASMINGVLLAGGLAILANSRPYEGFVLSLPGLAALAWRYAQAPREVVKLLPGIGVLAAVAGLMLDYNRAVTGSPWKLPYQRHNELYGVAPAFVFQKLRPAPEYRHLELEELHGVWEREGYEKLQTARGLFEGLIEKAQTLAVAVFRLPSLGFALLGLPCLLRSLGGKLIVGWLGWFMAGLACETWMHPHYAAPAAPLIVALVLESARRLRVLRVGSVRIGLLTWQITLILAMISSVQLAGQLLRIKSAITWSHARDQLARELIRKGGRHLVFVRYSPGHSVHEEWVYNGADIENSPVIWARAMSEKEDAELQRHFSDRSAWRVLVRPQSSQVISLPPPPS